MALNVKAGDTVAVIQWNSKTATREPKYLAKVYKATGKRIYTSSDTFYDLEGWPRSAYKNGPHH